MKILNRKAEMTAATIAWQGEGGTVCLVPTMGNIHQGHLALIAAARATASRVIVSIYVNPTQFGAARILITIPARLMPIVRQSLRLAAVMPFMRLPKCMMMAMPPVLFQQVLRWPWKARQGRIFLPALLQLF